jgi:hypothetical protein
MGFVKDVANAATFGLAGAALKPFGSSKKKKPVGPTPMIQLSNAPAPTSMIGSGRGGY